MGKMSKDRYAFGEETSKEATYPAKQRMKRKDKKEGYRKKDGAGLKGKGPKRC